MISKPLTGGRGQDQSGLRDLEPRNHPSRTPWNLAWACFVSAGWRWQQVVRGSQRAARPGGSQRQWELLKPCSPSRPKCEVCQGEGLPHTRLSMCALLPAWALLFPIPRAQGNPGTGVTHWCPSCWCGTWTWRQKPRQSGLLQDPGSSCWT